MCSLRPGVRTRHFERGGWGWVGGWGGGGGVGDGGAGCWVKVKGQSIDFYRSLVETIC